MMSRIPAGAQLDGGRGVRLGILLGITVSASLFTALTAALLVLRSGGQSLWRFPEPIFPLMLSSVATVVLVIGSFMLEVAQASLARGDYLGMRATLLNASAKGLAFVALSFSTWVLVGGQKWVPGAVTFPALYALASGLHVLHVVVATALVVPLALGKETPHPHRVRNAALVWHFCTGIAVLLLVLFQF